MPERLAPASEFHATLAVAIGVALVWLCGGFVVALGSQLVAYQMALEWL
jgi:hypothetical protein